MGRETIDRGEVAADILAAASLLGRWWAQDFKPGRAPDDLTGTQFAILSIARDMPSINLSQLADQLDLSVPTVVRAVDALERKNLVIRQRISMRQRDVTIALTGEGQEIREFVERARCERLLELLGRMSDAEVKGLLLGYQGMVRALSIEPDGTF
jgi:DNA-binding MarR family transcriptional regulator